MRNHRPYPAETLPAAVARWRQLGMPLLLELLGGMRVVVAGGASVPAAACSGAPGSAAGGAAGGTTGGAPRAERAYAQQLVVQAQALLQVCNALNEEYPQVGGSLGSTSAYPGCCTGRGVLPFCVCCAVKNTLR